jgi:hypothetical protein
MPNPERIKKAGQILPKSKFRRKVRLSRIRNNEEKSCFLAKPSKLPILRYRDQPAEMLPNAGKSINSAHQLSNLNPVRFPTKKMLPKRISPSPGSIEFDFIQPEFSVSVLVLCSLITVTFFTF